MPDPFALNEASFQSNAQASGAAQLPHAEGPHAWWNRYSQVPPHPVSTGAPTPAPPPSFVYSNPSHQPIYMSTTASKAPAPEESATAEHSTDPKLEADDNEEALRKMVVRISACIPPDALSASEQAQFFTHLHLLYPHLLPTLHLLTSTTTSLTSTTLSSLSTSSPYHYHYTALISLSPPPSYEIEPLIESAKFQADHQAAMGERSEKQDGEVSFGAMMVRSLYCAVEEVVEERMGEARVRRKMRERKGEGMRR